jgi:hypothetical protein
LRALYRRTDVTGAVHVLTALFRTFSRPTSTLGFVAPYNFCDKNAAQSPDAALRHWRGRYLIAPAHPKFFGLWHKKIRLNG